MNGFNFSKRWTMTLSSAMFLGVLFLAFQNFTTRPDVSVTSTSSVTPMPTNAPEPILHLGSTDSKVSLSVSPNLGSIPASYNVVYQRNGSVYPTINSVLKIERLVAGTIYRIDFNLTENSNELRLLLDEKPLDIFRGTGQKHIIFRARSPWAYITLAGIGHYYYKANLSRVTIKAMPGSGLPTFAGASWTFNDPLILASTSESPLIYNRNNALYGSHAISQVIPTPNRISKYRLEVDITEANRPVSLKVNGQEVAVLQSVAGRLVHSFFNTSPEGHTINTATIELGTTGSYSARFIVKGIRLVEEKKPRISVSIDRNGELRISGCEQNKPDCIIQFDAASAQKSVYVHVVQNFASQSVCLNPPIARMMSNSIAVVSAFVNAKDCRAPPLWQTQVIWDLSFDSVMSRFSLNVSKDPYDNNPIIKIEGLD